VAAVLKEFRETTGVDITGILSGAVNTPNPDDDAPGNTARRALAQRASAKEVSS
jgi:hypothetical protein